MMKKWGLALLLAACLLAVSAAQAEYSANLEARRTYNKDNLLIQLDYIDGEGNPVIADDLGYATVKYTYKGSNLMETAFYDADGLLTNCVDGWAKETNTRGQKYVLMETVYTDADGMRTAGPEGWASKAYTYNGNKVGAIRYYDASGAPYRSETQPAAYEASYKIKPNTGGSRILTEERYLDADGLPMTGPDG